MREHSEVKNWLVVAFVAYKPMAVNLVHKQK